MMNAAGRDIPEKLIRETGKEPFHGSRFSDGKRYQKTSVTSGIVMNSEGTKLVGSICEALKRCDAHDGMTISFHHHFREGDRVMMQVMDAVHALGLKDVTLCASSLCSAQDGIVPYIEDGTVTGIETSGMRGAVGKAVSGGLLKKPAVFRSHGGRVRAIESGETKIDIAFIGAPTSDEYGNCRGVGGISNCGVLSYSAIDAEYASYTIVLTDCLVPFPNFPSEISMTKVDYVVKVDSIGDASKIATGAARPVRDMRKILMAQKCAEFIACTSYFKDGFSLQTGIGGASIAAAALLAEKMKQKNIHMSFGAGGMSRPMCDLLKQGLVGALLDTQDFDLDSIDSLQKDPRHFSITAEQYADPFCRGAVVNRLDFVILGTLEADIHFNCNVLLSSEGELIGALGGHPDTAAGAKCSIVVTPLVQGRIPAIRSEVTAVTTPGEDIDVIVTDYGTAVNPKREDLIEMAEKAGYPLKSIQELRDLAYSICGEPAPVRFEDRIVGIIEARDGTVIDVVRKKNGGSGR